MKKFPNGFESWMETFYEIVSFISQTAGEMTEDTQIAKSYDDGGRCEMYRLALEWTDDFEKLNEGRVWDGQFFEEVEGFCKIKNQI